jgi:hypothetical protein
MKPTRIVELVIQDDNQELAIDAISLVSAPAIEQDFVYFGKEKSNLTLAKVDEEKRMLISPALIPNKNIVRYDANTDSEYYVWFSKETVRKASELYLKHNNHHKATYEHQDRVSGVLTVESWIKEGDMDKSKLYGFDLPNGSWFVKMKIDNEELWQDIKSKKIKGLSIEGYFTDKFEAMQKKQPTTEQVLKALNEIIRENKTKLKTEKVELSMADDLKNIVSDAKRIIGLQEDGFKWGEKAETQFKEVKKVISDAEGITRGAIRQAGTLKKESDKVLNKIEVQAKELGVPVNDVKGYKEANKLINEMFENQNALNGWNEMLKKIL